MIAHELGHTSSIAQQQQGTARRREVTVADRGPGLVWAAPISFAITLAILIYLARMSF